MTFEPPKAYPGWYQDPDSPALRWWDGVRWTANFAPPPGSVLPNSLTHQSASPTAATQPAWQMANSPAPLPGTNRGPLIRRSICALLIAVVFGGLIAGILNHLFAALRGDTTVYFALFVLAVLLVGCGYLSNAVSSRAAQVGPADARSTYRRTISIGGGIAGILAFAIVAGVQFSAGPSVSGSDLQAVMRGNLGATTGSPVIVSTIRCPVSKDYVAGDVARCIASTSTGRTVVFLVTVTREDDEWHYSIDVE